MSEPVTWAAVGMAAVSNMATWLMIIKGNRAAKANGRLNNQDGGNGQRPGTAKVCIERGEKIVELRTRQENFEQTIVEMKGDIKAIKGAVVER
jgi:hypothetical protein